MKPVVMGVECPCGTVVDVDLRPYIAVDEDDGTQTIEIDADMSDMWAHRFTHEGDPDWIPLP